MGQCLNAIKLDAVAIHRHPNELPRDVVESAQSIIEVSSRVYDVATRLDGTVAGRLRSTSSAWPMPCVHMSQNGGRRNSKRRLHSAAIEGDLDGLGEADHISRLCVVQELPENIARQARPLLCI
jgi:hypothetical protein